MGLLRLVLKSSVVGGLVYYTIQEGLWSHSEESVKLYGKIYSTVTPYIKKNVPQEVLSEIPDLPSTSDISNFVKAKWNKGVLISMKFLVDLPTHTSNGIDAVLKQPALSDLFKSSTESLDNKQNSSKAQ